MDRESAMKEFESIKRYYLSFISREEDYCDRITLQTILKDKLDGILKHLDVIYAKNMEVGEKLTPLEQYEGNQGYQFWIERIQRHLEVCQDCLREVFGNINFEN